MSQEPNEPRPEVKIRSRSNTASYERLPPAIPADSVVPEIIGKTLVDQGFRAEFFADKEKVMAGYALTDAEKTVLNNLSNEDITKHIEDLGGAVAWKIAVEITKSF